ncbi:MAG: hypothetical protein Kow0010_25510 [Dehalococcoidia bacterium]
MLDRVDTGGARTGAHGDLLLELARLVCEGHGLADTFDAYARKLLRMTTFDFAALVMRLPDGRSARVVGHYPQGVVEPADLEPHPVEVFGLHHLDEFPSGREVPVDAIDAIAWRGMAAAGLKRVWTAPLAGGRGALAVARARDEPFGDEALSLLQMSARFLGSALEQEANVERARQSAARSQLLNDIAVLLNDGRPVEALVDRMLDLIEPAIQFDYVELLLATGEPRRYRVLVSRPEVLEHGEVVEVPETTITAILDTGSESVQYNPARFPSLRGPRSFAEAGLTRMLTTLLRHNGELVGLLSFGRHRGIAYDADDRAFVDVLCTLLAQGIVNRKQIEASRMEAADQRIIAEAAAAAARESDIARLSQALVEPLRGLIPRPFVALGYIEGADVVYEAPGRRPIRHQSEWYQRATVNAGQVHVPAVPGEVMAIDAIRELDVRSLSMTELRSRGETVGYLVIGARGEAYEFRDRDLRIFRVIAQIVGPAVANAVAAARTERERATFHLTLESLREAVILLDRELQPVWANRAARVFFELKSPPDQQLPHPVQSALAQGRLPEGQFHLVTIDGQERWYEAQAIPIDHPVYGFVVVATDVTRQRQLESERERHRREMEQAARLAALGQLVGGVAHELNNPLTAIIGFSELLAMQPLAGEAADHVDVIKREAHRAGNIVRDLLVIARPTPVAHAPVSIREMLRHLDRVRRPEWERRGITVSIDAPANDPPLTGNEHQLMQVLVNLVTNAEQAVEGTDNPRIDIRAREGDGHVSVEVCDNGCGMDHETQARIFEPFFTTRKGAGGTGLGLSLSYTIIQSHNGRIEVESAPGKGTRFAIMLPVESTHAEEDGSRAEQADPPRGARVLVVDDEPSLRNVCQRLVAAIGHRCETAGSAQEAIARARTQDYDVVLCDFRLGADSAESVVRRFAEEAPHLVPRTVIATGATTEPGVLELAAEYNLRLIAKPYGMNELREAIDTVYQRAG